MKLCKDCQYYLVNHDNTAAYDKCAFEAEIDLVRGGRPIVTKFCSTQRKSTLAEDCGPEGKFWTEKKEG